MTKPENAFLTIHPLWLFFPLLSELFSIPHPYVVSYFLPVIPSLLFHHFSTHWHVQSSPRTTEAKTPNPWLFLTGISLKKKMMKMRMLMKITLLMKQWLSSMVESFTNAMTILKPCGTMLKTPPEHWFMGYCNVQWVFITSPTRFLSITCLCFVMFHFVYGMVLIGLCVVVWKIKSVLGPNRIIKELWWSWGRDFVNWERWSSLMDHSISLRKRFQQFWILSTRLR